MKFRNKLIPLIAGLALLCPLAICHHNVNASEESTYYANSSYNNQPRQQYSYYDSEAYINTGSTAGTYDNNYTGKEPHDSEVQSALDYLHKTSNEDMNVQDLSGDKVPERMEYTPDPVDLKMYYYQYDPVNPNKTSVGYSVSDYQFNKGDTVNMNQMIKISGDSTVNIMKHPSNFTITKNTLISIPVSQQVNATVNVTPVNQNGGDDPQFSIYHLQPDQKVNLSKYLENYGYNPVNKNYVITVPDNISDGLSSDYKVPVTSNNFNPDEIEPGINHSSNSDDNSGQLTSSQINSEMSKADQPYTPSYASDAANLSSSLSSENTSDSYYSQSTNQSDQSSQSSDDYSNSSTDSDNNNNDYSEPSNSDEESIHYSKPAVVITHKKSIHKIRKRNKAQKKASKHNNKKYKIRKHYKKLAKKSYRKRNKIRYQYVSKRKYRNIMKYKKNLYRKMRKLRHHSRKYKSYKKSISKLSNKIKHMKIRK